MSILIYLRRIRGNAGPAEAAKVAEALRHWLPAIGAIGNERQCRQAGRLMRDVESAASKLGLPVNFTPEEKRHIG